MRSRLDIAVGRALDAGPARCLCIQYSILTDPTARVTAQQEGSTLVMELVTADAVGL